MIPAKPARAPLRVCYPFIGNNVGGSHISTVMLVGALDRNQVEPVVVLHEEGALADHLRQRELSYRLIDIQQFFAPPYLSLRNMGKLASQTWRIATFLRRERIDVVHANDVRIHFGWTLATRLAGSRLVWHQRTGSFGNSIVKLALARLSHRVVCISQYTASTLPRQLAPLIRVVANPFEVGFATIDRNAARSRVLAELALPPETRVVGFFGNLVQQKRPAVFLRAAAEIAARTEDRFAFLLFGAERDGAQARLTALARELGIAGLVHFMGFRSPVEPWMASCDLIIAPGVGEGLGRSLVEAMIVGSPVVAADSGGHRDVIRPGENGLLVAADDHRAFAAAALTILRNTTLAQNMATLAQSRAVHDYSIDGHVKMMTEIYAACAADAPARRLAEQSPSASTDPTGR
jgi:glycosyltransferase involved in cell wall biosynthesis